MNWVAAMIQGVDNIGVCVKDLPEAVAFYTKLGFAKAHENERGRDHAFGWSEALSLYNRNCRIQLSRIGPLSCSIIHSVSTT